MVVPERMTLRYHHDRYGVRVVDGFPLTIGQERYFAESADSADANAKTWLSYDFLGPLDVRALVSALRLVGDRHDGLRLRITMSGDGTPTQHAVAERPPVGLHEVTSRSAEQFRDYVNARLLDQVHRPWRHETEAPAHFLLFRRSAEHHALLAVFSHAAVDGRAVSVVGRELLAGYELCRQGRPVPHPARTFAEAATTQARRHRHRMNAPYWRDKLASARFFPQLADLLGPDSTGDTAVTEVVVLAGTDADRVAARRAELGATLAQLSIWALACAFAHVTGHDGVALLVLNDLRGQDDHDVIGMFVNRLPLILAVDGPEDRPISLAQVQRELLRLKFHGHVRSAVLADGYERVHAESGVRLRDAMSFSYVEHESDPLDRQPELVVETGRYSPLRDEGLRVPLVDVYLHAFPSETRIGLTCNRGVLGDESIAALVRRFRDGLCPR